MILVPLISVLYVLALSSFSIAGYYGFRLTRLARKLKVMIMITQDGPQSMVGAIVLLALSQAINLVKSVVLMPVVDFFDVTSVTLLVGSAFMFAFGFHKMYEVYMNERMRMSVNSILDDLAEKDGPFIEEAEEVKKRQQQQQTTKWKNDLR